MFLIEVFVTMWNNLIIVPHISVFFQLIKEELFSSFYAYMHCMCVYVHIMYCFKVVLDNACLGCATIEFC